MSLAIKAAWVFVVWLFTSHGNKVAIAAIGYVLLDWYSGKPVDWTTALAVITAALSQLRRNRTAAAEKK